MKIKILVDNIISRVKSSDIGNRIASGAFWSFTGTATAKLIVLIAGIFCARILGKEAYGQFGMVRSTINMFVVFGYAGLGLTATKYISEYLRPSPERVTSIYYLTNGFAFVTGLIVTVIVLILAPFLANNMLHCPELTDAIRVGAFLLFITVINGAQNGVLSGFEDFRDIARNTFIASLAESTFMLIGAYKFGVIGAVLGYGIGFCALYITNNIAIRSEFRQYNISRDRKMFRKEDLSLLYKFSLPAALSSIMVMPTFWVVRALLVRETNFGELAIYEAAEQWRGIILFIPTAVGQVVLPVLSSLVNTNRGKFWKILNVNIILNGSIALGIALIISLLSGYIMKWYGQGFDNKLPLIILALSTIFTSTANVVGLSISSRGKMWIGFMFNMIWATIFIFLTIIFIRMEMGATGVALALLLSYVAHFSYQMVYIRWISKKENFDGNN